MLQKTTPTFRGNFAFVHRPAAMEATTSFAAYPEHSRLSGSCLATPPFFRGAILPRNLAKYIKKCNLAQNRRSHTFVYDPIKNNLPRLEGKFTSKNKIYKKRTK